MADNFLFFTELVGMPVLDLKHRRIGRVRDAAIVPLMHSSRIDRVLVGGGDSWLTIRYDQIQSIALGKGIALSDEQLTPYHEDEYMLRIGRDLLDQQIIKLPGPMTTSTFNRRQFLKTTAVAGAAVALAQFTPRRLLAADAPPGLIAPTPSWVDKPMRWAQLTLVEDDPGKFDLAFWLDYFKRTHSDAV